MKIQVGKTYKDGHDRQWIIRYVDQPSAVAIATRVENGRIYTAAFALDGRRINYLLDVNTQYPNYSTRLNLGPNKVKHEGWTVIDLKQVGDGYIGRNIFSSNIYPTKEVAERVMRDWKWSGPVAKVEWEEDEE